MPISTDAFRNTNALPVRAIGDGEVKHELLRRVIGRSILGRLPILLPSAVIGITAMSIPQRQLLWSLLLGYLVVTFAAAFFSGRVKTAIEARKPKRKAIMVWYVTEFLASAIWGLMLIPISDSNLVGPESAVIATVMMVTVTGGSLISSNAVGLSKTIVAGLISTILPVMIVYYPSYWPLLIGSSATMFMVLIHLVNRLQKEAMRNLKTEMEHELLTVRLAEALDVAQHLSRHDSLTGLLNRRDFENSALEMRKKNSAGDAAVILIDLDHFKKTNDQFGHSVGDQALKAAAQLIKNNLRTYDTAEGEIETIARWGGEEFVIALTDSDIEDAANTAELIRESFEAYTRPDWPEQLQMTGSFGVTLWDDGENLKDAIARADHAMFGAKNSGRNRVVVTERRKPARLTAI